MSGFFGRVLGGGNSSPENNKNENLIERLVISLNTSSMLTDRRTSLRALLSIVRDYPAQVGAVGLTSILGALERDSEDPEAAEYAIGILRVLCSPEEPNKLGQDQRLAFCELVLKAQSTINTLIAICRLQIGHTKGCFETLRLLQGLEETLPERLQQSIMSCPGGITLFMDLLGEPELIRNETIFLLTGLAKDSDDLQKIMAFEGAFEHILSILESEGDDNFVITDCLNLLRVLLAYNPSNQKYFCEGTCLGRLRGFLERSNTDRSSQDALDIVSLFLPRSSQKLAAMQNVLVANGMLKALLEIINNPTTTSPTASRAFGVLASLIWKNRRLQESLGPMTVASSNDHYPIPFLLAVIWRAVYGGRFGGSGDLRLFSERLAAAHLVEAFLRDHPDGQISIGALLTPPPPALEDVGFKDGMRAGEARPLTYSAGSVLVAGLLDLEVNRKDPYRSWFAAHLFSLVLLDCPLCKQIALAHHLDSGGEDQVTDSLLELVAQRVLEASRDRHLIRPMIGYLGFLIAWFEDYPPAVGKFTEESGRVQMLLELLSISGLDPAVQGLAAMLVGLLCIDTGASAAGLGSREIRAIVRDRIGVDLFTSRLARLFEYCMASRSVNFDPSNPATFPMIPEYLCEKILHTSLLDSLSKAIVGSIPPPSSEIDLLKSRIRELEVELANKDSRIQQLEDISTSSRKSSLPSSSCQCAMLMDNLLSMEAENSLLLETITLYERYLLGCNVDLAKLQEGSSNLSSFPPTNQIPTSFTNDSGTFRKFAAIEPQRADVPTDDDDDGLIAEKSVNLEKDDFFDQLAVSLPLQDTFNAQGSSEQTGSRYSSMAEPIDKAPSDYPVRVNEFERKSPTAVAAKESDVTNNSAPLFNEPPFHEECMNSGALPCIKERVIPTETHFALTNQSGLSYGSNSSLCSGAVDV